MDGHRRKFSNTLTPVKDRGLKTTGVVVTWASFNFNSMHTVAWNIVKSKADFEQNKDACHACVENKCCKTREGIDPQTRVNTAENDANSCLLAHITSF